MQVTLVIQVNTDPVPGTFHEPEDFEVYLREKLERAFPWYKPKVTLVGPQTVQEAGDWANR
jgi:hypothetical protein